MFHVLILFGWLYPSLRCNNYIVLYERFQWTGCGADSMKIKRYSLVWLRLLGYEILSLWALNFTFYTLGKIKALILTKNRKKIGGFLQLSLYPCTYLQSLFNVTFLSLPWLPEFRSQLLLFRSHSFKPSKSSPFQYLLGSFIQNVILYSILSWGTDIYSPNNSNYLKWIIFSGMHLFHALILQLI